MLTVMSMVACAWALAGLVLRGLGVLGHWLLRLGPTPGVPLFWVGFALALGVLQVWQLFHPVDGCAALALASVGAPALAVHLWRGRASPWRPQALPASLFVAAVALWLSNLALGGDNNPDSGAYYVSTLRWLQEYPLPPGLGNLSFALALNHSYFLYVALLDVGPFHHQAQHLANGLLLLAALWHAAAGLWRHLEGGDVRPSHTVAAVLFVPLVEQTRRGHLTSPAADMAVFVLGTMLVLELLRLLEARTSAERSARRRVLTVLASAGVVMKSSLVCVAAPALLAVAWSALASEGTPRRRGARLAGVGLLGSLWVLPWMVRSVVLSGYPLFPLPRGVLPVSWRMDPERVVWVHRYIRAFARQPGAPLDEVLGGWGWLRHWAAPLWLFNWEFLIPVLILLVGAVAWWRLRQRPAPSECAPAALLLLIGLVLWFLLAPDLRFAGALLWGLAGVVVARAVHAGGPPPRLTRRMTAVAALGLAACALPGLLPLWLPQQQLTPLPETQGELRRTDSGLEVRFSRGKCFEALCTPFFNPRLRLREEGNPGAGFELEPSSRSNIHTTNNPGGELRGQFEP